MNFQQFATSNLGTRLWMALGYSLPPRTGQVLARGMARFLAKRTQSSLYRAIAANQSVVLGPPAAPETLDRAVGGVLQHAARVSYDLMHIVAAGERAIRAAVEFGPNVWADLAAAAAGGRGVICCAGHISNFNLGLLAFGLQDLPLQIISRPGKSGGFEIVARLRARGVIQDTPSSASALMKAVRHLRAGGMALTGVDWPEVTVEKEKIPFFGCPAYLPTGHVRLAMMAGARLLPVALRWDRERGYYVETAPPLELELTGNRAYDVVRNARRVLAVLERWIKERPEQWLMYHPVWESIPDARF